MASHIYEEFFHANYLQTRKARHHSEIKPFLILLKFKYSRNDTRQKRAEVIEFLLMRDINQTNGICLIQ